MSLEQIEQKEEKQTITYESFIAGALLKFNSIDSVDFSLLVEDFEKKTNIEVKGLSYDLRQLSAYIEILKDGTIKIRDDISLDLILREKLHKVAGNEVNNYFENFDIEKYKQERKIALTNNKKKVLWKANVLLISDNQDDYDALVKYGFKNVDYFKSIIRADKYFAMHPEELKKYHIILEGHQSIERDFSKDTELDRAINNLKNETHLLATYLFRCDYLDYIELYTYLIDNHNYRDFRIEERAYSDLFDRIVENTLINHTLENVDLKNMSFQPVQEYVNPNRLPLPAKKSDLKILYLGYGIIDEYVNKIASDLGINITFKEDNNYGLKNHVNNHLGEYDIIIASRGYSSNLLGMNIESTEQCKDTGRDLTLLVTYDDTCWGVDTKLGNRIILRYVYGGSLAPNVEKYTKEFNVLRQPIEIDDKDQDWTVDIQGEYSDMKAILEASVNFYNDALAKANKPTLDNLDLKSADELDYEYTTTVEKQEQEREAELAPIRAFSEIGCEVIRYLSYKNQGLTNQIPEGLKITEGEDTIKVENIYDGKTFCSIIISKVYKQENLRMFEIQTLSKKGNLSQPQTIGLYTSEYNNSANIPARPNEAQARALLSIKKKIEAVLKPFNDNVLELANSRELEPKKRKRRKKYYN